MARRSQATFAKRQRETDKRAKRQGKEMERARRKAEKALQPEGEGGAPIAEVSDADVEDVASSGAQSATSD